MSRGGGVGWKITSLGLTPKQCQFCLPLPLSTQVSLFVLRDHWLVWRVARWWWHRSTLYRSKTSFLSENHVSASTVLSLPMTNPSRIVYVARCGRLSVCPYRGDTVLVVACKNRIRRSHPSTPVLSSHPHIEIDMHSAYPAQGGWQALWLWRLVKLFAVLPSLVFCRAQSDREERTNICLLSLGLNRMAGDVVPWFLF